MACLVISSLVGPKPPVTMMISALPSASFKAFKICSLSSWIEVI